MQQWQIVAYELGWNHMSNQPYVLLQLQGVAQAMLLQVNSADEMTVLIAILGRSPVFYRQDGLIITGLIQT